MNKTTVILQKNNSAEVCAISSYAAIVDDIKVIYSEYRDLSMYIDELKQGAIPVGSVEFVQYAFKLLGIEQPKFDCYDDSFYEHFKRQINYAYVDDFYDGTDVFIKPVKLKQFNGFVFKGFDYDSYDDHDLEQVNVLKNIPDDEDIFVSDIVNFIAEWRCYITNGELKSYCRYDDNEQEYDFSMPDGLIEKLKGRTIAVDMGLMDNGEYSIVELNDAWAIGRYNGIRNKDYFEFLKTRWLEIIK